MTESQNDPMEQEPRELIYEAARRLVAIGQDPQPGLSSWNDAMESVYLGLINEVFKWHSPDGAV